MEFSSLCCTVGPCCLSILCVIICIYYPRLPVHPSSAPWQPQVCSFSVSWDHLCHVLDYTYKWYRVVFVSFWVTSLSMYSPGLSMWLQMALLRFFLWLSHWKDRCWSSNTLATWCKELTQWKRPWCWQRLKAGGEGDERGWDGWMASPTQWASVSLSKLQELVMEREAWHAAIHGSQRVRYDWVTEMLNILLHVCMCVYTLDLLYPSVHGHFICFHVLTIVNSAAIWS